MRVIRKHSDNIVICGTPKWPSDVDVASTAPVAGESIAYTFHFHAATHGESLHNKCRTALNNGVALFATEWGTCEASAKSESCSALRAKAPSHGNWQTSHLTDSGRFVRNSFQKHHLSGRCSAAHQNYKSTGCCSNPGWQCFEKSAEWATCKRSCTPGSPVAEHGQLTIRGNQIIGKHGKRVRLRGMSMFWSQWMGKYWNLNVVKWLQDVDVASADRVPGKNVAYTIHFYASSHGEWLRD